MIICLSSSEEDDSEGEPYKLDSRLISFIDDRNIQEIFCDTGGNIQLSFNMFLYCVFLL